MKIHRSLPRLRARMLRHMQERQACLAHLRALSRPLTAKDLAFLVIDTHNLLGLFMRSYCLASLAGAYTAIGHRITNKQAIRGYDAAMTFAVTTARPSLANKGPPWTHRHEPTWHVPGEVVKVLVRAGCSNATGVSNTLSPLPTAMTHWTTARNFFAHRNAHTAGKVRALGVHYSLGLPRDPLAVVSALNVAGQRMIVEDWFEEVGELVAAFPE